MPRHQRSHGSVVKFAQFILTRPGLRELHEVAAHQEFAEQSTRKTYLDTQYGDLTQALETLEGAIKK